MILKHLALTHFKNYETAFFTFSDHINCVLGKNGQGKTNLLDAIYYLSFTKSAVGSPDKLAVMHNMQAFILHGTYENLTVAIQFEKEKKKTIKINGKEPERLSDIIGTVPLVISLPDDTSMIREGSGERRKFFDGALSQFDGDYLRALIQYNTLLKQRNGLLKQGERFIDYKLMETYDDQLIPLAKKISKKRNWLKEIFLPFIKKNYSELHKGKEIPDIYFKTHVNDAFEENFKANFEKDRLMQRTLLGSHQDDFEFLLRGELIKKFGSQGQQKTFVIALKLALYDFLKEKTGKKPLLLFDDIFDKLDDTRISLLVSLLEDRSRFGQIFITDARKGRTKTLFKEKKDMHFIEITR